MREPTKCSHLPHLGTTKKNRDPRDTPANQESLLPAQRRTGLQQNSVRKIMQGHEGPCRSNRRRSRSEERTDHDNLLSQLHEESPGYVDEKVIFLMEMKHHEEEDLKFLKNQCRKGTLPLKYSLVPFIPNQVN
jgi:hypothetical protein